MSDSDEDENFELYGTPLDPLDEDSITKKKPFSIEDQIATDDQGRRRFHGAFTGGFSAGFFNTVGSSEGWKPTEFRSSRSEKADKKIQKPEDFMDNEDLGEFGIAHKKLKATSDYEQKKKRKRPQNFDGPIPGEPILFSLLEPARETIGVKLLKKMGWKPGQGVGPRISKKEKNLQKKREKSKKIYECQKPPENQKNSDFSEPENSDFSDSEISDLTFAPDDYDPYLIRPKNDIFGLGYFGLAPRAQNTQNFAPSFRLTERNNKKFSISGQAFGVGAFETEDLDIYSKDDISNYDFELGGPPKIEKKVPTPQKFYHSSILDGFTPQKLSQKYIKKRYPPPEVPKNFIPKHGVRISRFEPLPESHELFDFEKKTGRHDLKHFERSKILNESFEKIEKNLSKNFQNMDQNLSSENSSPSQFLSLGQISSQNLGLGQILSQNLCSGQILRQNLSLGQNLSPNSNLVKNLSAQSEKEIGAQNSGLAQNLINSSQNSGLVTNSGLRDQNLNSNSPIKNQNLDQKIQNLLDSCKNKFNTKNLNIDSKAQIIESRGQNSDPNYSTINSKTEHLDPPNFDSKPQNSDQKTHFMNFTGSKKNDWRAKLFSPNFCKGEILGDNVTQKDSKDPMNSLNKIQNDPNAHKLDQKSPKCIENEILLEKARKLTEGLPKIECRGFKPFLADIDKQKRYEIYLSLIKSDRKDQLTEIQPISMSDFEKEREKYEFEQASKLFKPNEGLVFDKFITGSNQGDDLDPLKSVSRSVFDHGTLEMREAARKKLFGPLTRVVLPWQPHKLLCRRFNVPEPKTSDELVVPSRKRNRFNIFDYYEAYQQNRPKENQNEENVSIIEASSSQIEERSKSSSKTEEILLISKENPSKSKENLPKTSTSASKIEESTSKTEAFLSTTEINASKTGVNSSKVKVQLSETEEKVVFNSEERSSKLEENTPKAGSSKNELNPFLTEESTSKSKFKNDEKSSKIEEENIFIPIDPKAKKDLFKAIFLSSDESNDENESESEKNSQDKLEEMKKIVEESLVEKLDEQNPPKQKTDKQKSKFDEEKSSMKNEEISSKEEKSSNSNKKRFFSDLDLTKFQKSNNKNEISSKPEEISSNDDRSSFYGPVLPKKQSISTEKRDLIEKTDDWKPVFTKPVSKNLNKDILKQGSSITKIEEKKNKFLKIIDDEPSSSSSDEWVEVKEKSSKRKKSSKKNKKHKDKHKKHKSKHKKRKKSDSD